MVVGGAARMGSTNVRGGRVHWGHSVHPKMELGCQIVDQRREDWLCYGLGLDRFIVAFS